MKMMIITFIAAVMLSIVIKTSAAEISKRLDLSVNLDQSTNPDQSYLLLQPAGSYDINTGKDIMIPLSVYRGSTLKRTVYIWIQDKEGNRISSKSKHSLAERFTHYNLSAMLNFSKCYLSDQYLVVAEGLDINATQKINIDFPDCENLQTTNDGMISFSIIESVEEIGSGVKFRTRVLMSNPTEENIEVDAWSYVYRGSVSFSGEREQNIKTVNLPEFSNVTFDLENIIQAEPGNYTLKIKLLRSDRKTPKEFSIPIVVVGKMSEDALPDVSKNETSDVVKKSLAIKSGMDESNSVTDIYSTDDISQKNRTLFDSIVSKDSSVVYESSSAKARKLTVYFLILALILVLAALILKRL